jgi:uncharacterized membrane protein YphA (DoxX/SURF4 family)
MGTMTDSMAQPDDWPAKPLEREGWKTMLGWGAAILLAFLFLVSGLWKISDSQAAAIRMAQARVPQQLSLAAALVFGILETLAGVLVLVPRFRRWGALLSAGLLVAFMIYVGVEYNALRGEDCSCFPWLRRVVGPAFFAGDLAMLALAVIAWRWARPSDSLRSALVVLGAVIVFAMVSYGVNAVREQGVQAPAAITVDGQTYSLERGKVMLFFFHPQCMHCFDSARRMSEAKWTDGRVIGVPVAQPNSGRQFMEDSGLRAPVSTDFPLLSGRFHYTSYPFGVVLEDGVEKAALTNFEGDEPIASLRKLGLIQ